MNAPICPYCDKPAEPATGARIYPGRKDLARLHFWLCEPCDAYVGCHKPNRHHGFTGVEPLGRLANWELRRAKQRAHEAFDPLWRGGLMSRRKAYRWLAGELGLPVDDTHIGMFDVETCNRVAELARQYLSAQEFGA